MDKENNQWKCVVCSKINSWEERGVHQVINKKVYSACLYCGPKISQKIKEINNLIPLGPYCYSFKSENGIFKTCKFWSCEIAIDKNTGKEYKCGYCSFLGKNDIDLNDGLLWDQVKECGINLDIEGENEDE